MCCYFRLSLVHIFEKETCVFISKSGCFPRDIAFEIYPSHAYMLTASQSGGRLVIDVCVIHSPLPKGKEDIPNVSDREHNKFYRCNDIQCRLVAATVPISLWTVVHGDGALCCLCTA